MSLWLLLRLFLFSISDHKSERTGHCRNCSATDNKRHWVSEIDRQTHGQTNTQTDRHILDRHFFKQIITTIHFELDMIHFLEALNLTSDFKTTLPRASRFHKSTRPSNSLKYGISRSKGRPNLM
jgi:hypothetical protein